VNGFHCGASGCVQRARRKSAGEIEVACDPEYAPTLVRTEARVVRTGLRVSDGTPPSRPQAGVKAWSGKVETGFPI